MPEANALIHLAPFPDDAFRWQCVGLVLASLFGTLIWDRLCTAIFAPEIFKAQVDEARKTTLKDVEPVIMTFAKVVGGCLLLAQGNILVVGAAVYLYRQHSKASAKQEKQRKDEIIRGGVEKIN